jgi:hypothetical protein
MGHRLASGNLPLAASTDHTTVKASGMTTIAKLAVYRSVTTTATTAKVTAKPMTCQGSYGPSRSKVPGTRVLFWSQPSQARYDATVKATRAATTTKVRDAAATSSPSAWSVARQP